MCFGINALDSYFCYTQCIYIRQPNPDVKVVLLMIVKHTVYQIPQSFKYSATYAITIN